MADRLRMLEKLENISLAAASLPDTILKVRHSRAMLFINPMWDNEAERIGKQKCTPLGYALHAFSDLLGFVALFLVFGVTAYLGYRRIVREFRASLLWIFSIPFGLAIIGSILYQISWVLAQRRGFCYDYESREASWIDHGQRHTYKSNDA
ncbi:MAG TPA: hypothetical protein VGR78_09955 [Verrucomicrobiae bacterium]|nr:hypothetical protein [Verrucomicrobiae bacterium]